MDLLLPKDGSIVIIDDNYNDAKPLLDILTKNGHPSIYFDGDLTNLPKNKTGDYIPLERVRIIFADIQLRPALNDQQYASLIIEHLDLLIPQNNGPYILIVWSGKEAQLADRLKEMIEAEGFNKKPISFIRLDKGDYFKSAIKENMDFNSLRNNLETRFSQQDIDFIIEQIRDEQPDTIEKTCDTKALKKISNKIKDHLSNFKAFELLIKWENLVNKAATQLTSELASIHKSDENWDFNFRNIISRLAQSQVGDSFKTLSAKDFTKAAFKAFNAAFTDSLDNQVLQSIKILPNEFSAYKESGFAKVENNIPYRIVWSNYTYYQLFIDSVQQGGNNLTSIDSIAQIFGNHPERRAIVVKMISEYRGFNPELNTKFNIDLVTQYPFQPGSTYEVNVTRIKKREYLNDTYFDKRKINFLLTKNDNFTFSDNSIDEIKFIELEVSPNCDFANNKWIKHRTISGIFYPQELVKIDQEQSGDSLYTEFPLIKVNKEIMRVLFSFKLLKSFDLSRGKKRSRNFLFKIKEQPMADIITRMASHASRIGLIEFK